MKKEIQNEQLLASLTIKKETIYRTERSASSTNGFMGITQTSGTSIITATRK